MWVVKLGGSLICDPLLPHWLTLLAQLGGGRVTVVSGGGGPADEVRRLQRHWAFNDLAAHNMAVLAMVQSAYLMHALNPELQLARRQADIPAVLHRGQTALWLPFELQREAMAEDTNWGNSSDSIALALARHLNAERLVVVKSCRIDPALGIPQLVTAGVLDQGFAKLAVGAAFPIDLLHKADLDRMHGLLLGEARRLPQA